MRFDPVPPLVPNTYPVSGNDKHESESKTMTYTGPPHTTREPLDLWVPLTDEKGMLLVSETHEPEPGSILLTEGAHGTAWQRHFGDGKWYSTTGRNPRTWKQLIGKRNVVLVYDAAPREAERLIPR